MPSGFYNDIMFADNVDFSGDFFTNNQAVGQVTLPMQLMIGTGSTPAIDVGVLKSPDLSVTIQYDNPDIELFVNAQSLNVITQNATPQFAPFGGSALALDFGIGNLVLGSSLPSNAGAIQNVGIGYQVLNAATSSQSNTCAGYISGTAITSGSRNCSYGAGSFQTNTTSFDCVAIGYEALKTSNANFNTAVGSQSLQLCTSALNTAVGFGSLSALVGGTGSSCAFGYLSLNVATGSPNNAFGFGAMSRLTTGTDNTALGDSCGSFLLTGTRNLFVGYHAGLSYTTSESNNICIQNIGADFSNVATTGESGAIRIGTAGTHVQAYLTGVFNTNSGRVVKTTVPGAYPYTTLTTDYVILVDTSAARTINLVASPVTGTTYRIKDNVGSAAANNITIIPAAGNIDGAASFALNANYQAIDLVYNGTQWNKF